MRALPIFVDLVDRPVILIGDGEAAMAKRRLLERAGARIVHDEGDAVLAIVAVDDDALAEQIVERLRAGGALVNAVDRPALCDFTLPAIIDRDPVLIAIGTGGASAGLAKALRQRLEALLPASLGALAQAMAAARDAIRAKWPDASHRRRAIDVAFDPGGHLDPLVGNVDVSAWLVIADEPPSPAMARFELTSDDPDQLTLEQARWLARADTVYHAPGIARAILDRARADAHRVEWWSADDPPPRGLSVVLMRAMRR